MVSFIQDTFNEIRFSPDEEAEEGVGLKRNQIFQQNLTFCLICIFVDCAHSLRQNIFQQTK